MSPEDHKFEQPIVREIPPREVVTVSRDSGGLETPAGNEVAELRYETPYTHERVEQLKVEANLAAAHGIKRAQQLQEMQDKAAENRWRAA